MNYVLIVLLYTLVLAVDLRSVYHSIDRKERIVSIVFGILSVFSAIPAAYWMHLDHAGASLSGMLSQFISR